jgi:hypothetical protein
MTAIDDAIEALRRGSCPSKVILRALPGSGMRHSLSRLIDDISRRGKVLIVAPSLMEVFQWARLLGDATTSRVNVLRSTADALEARYSTELNMGGVFVCTWARAAQPQTAALLADRAFELVIFDGPMAPTQRLTYLIEASRQSVLLVAGTTAVDWPGAATLLDITAADFAAATAGVTHTRVEFDPEIDTLTAQATELLRRNELLPHDGNQSTTQASIHAALLHLATLPSTDVVDVEMAWRFLDQLDTGAAPDPRADALDRVVDAEPETRWIVVCGLKVAEAAYVADRLRGRGHETVLLTSQVAEEERARATSWTAHIVVVTAGMLSRISSWPLGYQCIWYSQPRSRAEFEHRMSLLAHREGARIIELAPVPRRN